MTPAPTDSLRAAAASQAQALLQEVQGVTAVVVASADGLTLAAAVRGSGDAARLSALASSICAIGDVVSIEAALGPSRCIVIESARGVVLVQSVPRRDFPLVLAVLARGDAVLGLVKFHAGAAAQALEAA